MSLAEELRWLDATTLSEQIRQGELQAAEVVEAAITRIEQDNPALNAVVTTMFEEARTAVAEGVVGPLAGMPYLLKDLGVPYAGVRLTGGSKALQNYVPQIDNTFVKRVKAAGLVTVGKTNTPEFGLLPTTESDLLGACKNPWDLSRSSGGSSGGAAAAVAAGFVPVAHATDGGGSIRIPAASCGLFGLKPTRARTPQGPVNGDVMNGLSIGHCISRSVRDSAALLDLIAGPDLGDPYVAPAPERDYLEAVTQRPSKLRIAFTTQSMNGHPIDPDCQAAVLETAKLCEALGHEVVEAVPPIDVEQFTNAFTVMWAAGCAWSVKGITLLKGQEKPQPEEYEPLTWAMYEMGERFSAADYLLAVQSVQQMARTMAHFLNGFEAWLTPVTAEPPLPLGSFDPQPDNPLAGFQRAVAYIPYTPIANATGQPAMSVPLYWNSDNLPIGSHFIGRFGDEFTLFQLATQLEEARPWAGKRPA